MDTEPYVDPGPTPEEEDPDREMIDLDGSLEPTPKT